MNQKLIDDIWDLDLATTPKIVLVCIASMANSNGDTEASLKLLCHRTSCSKGSLAYVLKALELIGVLKRTQQTTQSGKDTKTIYKINSLKNANQNSFQKSYQIARSYLPKPTKDVVIAKISEPNNKDTNIEKIEPIEQIINTEPKEQIEQVVPIKEIEKIKEIKEIEPVKPMVRAVDNSAEDIEYEIPRYRPQTVNRIK